jgi:hypothetical protein
MISLLGVAFLAAVQDEVPSSFPGGEAAIETKLGSSFYFLRPRQKIKNP